MQGNPVTWVDPDLLNSFWYALEGNYREAGLSLIRGAGAVGKLVRGVTRGTRLEKMGEGIGAAFDVIGWGAMRRWQEKESCETSWESHRI